MASSRNLSLQSEAAVAEATYTGDSTIVAARKAVVYLDCTAILGTAETLDVTIEGLDTVSGKWFLLATFAQLLAVGQERIAINDLLDDPIRAVGVVGGTGVAATWTVGLTIKDD